MSYVRVMSISIPVTLIEGGQWFFEGLGCGDLRIRDQSCSSVVVKYRYLRPGKRRRTKCEDEGERQE